MKKLVKKILFITVIIASLLLSSCGDMQKHSSAGLTFYLPKDMEEMTVVYADLCYGNGECEFFVYYYSRDELLIKNFIDKDSTSEEYLLDFIAFNEYVDVDFTADSEKNTATAKYLYESVSEYTYYCDFVIRTYNVLAHVTMNCDGELRDKYEPIFDEWIEMISMEELKQA